MCVCIYIANYYFSVIIFVFILNSPIHFKSIWVICASISHRRDTSFFKYWGELKHQTLILKIVTLEDILCRIASISYWLSENIEGIDLKYLFRFHLYLFMECNWHSLIIILGNRFVPKMHAPSGLLVATQIRFNFVYLIFFTEDDSQTNATQGNGTIFLLDTVCL